MPPLVEEHHTTLTGRADMPVIPHQRLRVLPLLEQPPRRPLRLAHPTPGACLHTPQYGAAVTGPVEGQTGG